MAAKLTARLGPPAPGTEDGVGALKGALERITGARPKRAPSPAMLAAERTLKAQAETKRRRNRSAGHARATNAVRAKAGKARRHRAKKQ